MPADDDQLAAHAEALALALADDPFYIGVAAGAAGDPLRAHEILCGYFRYQLADGPRQGRVLLADGGIHGAAIWQIPGTLSDAPAPSPGLAEVLGASGLANYRAINDAMAVLAGDAVPAGSWYLSIIGIAPHRQGRGHGDALMAPVLADADAAGASAFLETFLPRSERFYARYGFAPVARHREPITGADYCLMLRPPR